MSLPNFTNAEPKDGECQSDRESWSCINMRPEPGDTSMTHEHYACQVCGRRVSLDYDEMR